MTLSMMMQSDISPTSIPVNERLIVALDVPSIEDAQQVVCELGDDIVFYKIGMQLQFAGGLSFAEELVSMGKKVFLDSKLFDIEATVAHAVESVVKMGIDFLTVHGNGPTIRAAVKARGNSKLKLLSVTVLTSLDVHDIRDLGFHDISVEELALYRAKKALEAGADGVITSGQEAQKIRSLAGERLTIVTPGIRPDGASIDDQKRIVTPKQAIQNGADYIVVGRPILHPAAQYNSRKHAAMSILNEISEALSI